MLSHRHYSTVGLTALGAILLTVPSLWATGATLLALVALLPVLIRLRWWIVGAVLVWLWSGYSDALSSVLDTRWLLGAFVGTVAGGFVVWRVIYNSVVESDRQADHQGVDRKHDGRRI